MHGPLPTVIPSEFRRAIPLSGIGTTTGVQTAGTCRLFGMDSRAFP
jgi:hypothetical protein